MIKQRNFLTGFTLIELLVTISVIGFLVAASVVVFKQTRMSSRDATRVANIDTIRKALAMYLNDSTTGGYPESLAGECLSDGSVVGGILKGANVIVSVPVDPMWSTSPNPTPNTTPPYTTDSDGFCYFYHSDKSTYQLYYYLESNSKAGSAGPKMITQ